MSSSDRHVYCAAPLPAWLEVTPEYLPSKVVSVDRRFIHLFSIAPNLHDHQAKASLAPSEGHTKVCDGKTCAGLA
jgi:hypothetical protein